jgi:hypothetical protein
MTPKKKANELVLKFEQSLFGYDVFDDDWVKCINCALVAVDEILKVVSIYNDTQAEVTYWQEVKQEIEKL